jgi:hypothetical protein
MAHLASRARAEQAVVLRARGWTLQEIADELGYASRGSVRTAIDRELARSSPETADSARRSLLESARYTSRRWHDAFDTAVVARDVEAMAHAHRGLCRDRDMVAKLVGAYAPERAEVDVRVTSVEDTRKRLLAQLERDMPALPVIDAEEVTP